MKAKPSQLPNSLRIYLSQRHNNVTRDDFIETAMIADKFDSLADKIQGHCNGWHDGQFRNQIPFEFVKSLIINLAGDNIINWANVPKIQITQKEIKNTAGENLSIQDVIG